MKPYQSETDKKIQNLKNELWTTRYNLLSLIPEPYHKILTNYYFQTKEERHQWLDMMTQEILDLTQPIEKYKDSYSPRAYCPLCKQENSSWYGEEGFTFPEGLRRHLVGFGRTHQCVVTETAHKLALDYWHEKFAEIEKQEWIEKHEKLKQRKQVELLYKISPYDEGLLLDESLWYEARNSQQLDWATDRLNNLGFTKYQENNTISWIDEYENWIVYADIRQNGRIEFIVWKKPILKKKPANSYKHRISQFHLLDTWKNDLKLKYSSRLPK